MKNKSVVNINHKISESGPQYFKANPSSDIHLIVWLIIGHEVILVEKEHHSKGKVDDDQLHPFENILPQKRYLRVLLKPRLWIKEHFNL